MELKMYDVIAYIQHYQDTYNNLKVSFKTAYNFNLIYTELLPHYQFYAQKYNELLKEYGNNTSDETFISSVNDLLNLTVNVKDYKILMVDLEKIEIAPQALLSLMPFIKEDE